MEGSTHNCHSPRKSNWITERRQRELKRLEALPRGGGRDAAIAKAHVDSIEGLGEAYAESYIEAYSKSGLTFELSDANDVAAELDRLVRTWFSRTGETLTQQGVARFLATDPRDASAISAKLRRDLLARAMETKLGAEKSGRTSEGGDRNIIFISCGQFTEGERALGNAVRELLRQRTRLEPYFADQQSTFQGLTTHILSALNRSAGFIGIMHNRGTFGTPGGQITRGSVWIEQEIAVAAFIDTFLRGRSRFSYTFRGASPGRV